jgi:hypothetical protein
VSPEIVCAHPERMSAEELSDAHLVGAEAGGGNVGGNAFAIRIAEATKSRLLQAVFKPSDLKSSRVAVYGQRMGTVFLSFAFRIQCPRYKRLRFLPVKTKWPCSGLTRLLFIGCRLLSKWEAPVLDCPANCWLMVFAARPRDSTRF